MRGNKNRFYVIGIFTVLVMSVSAFCYRTDLFHAARYVDKNYLSEGLKDFKARLLSDEIWVWGKEPLAYDYGWLDNAERVVRIAHGLGGKTDTNTFAAFRNSRARGFRFFEVDLWLDDANIVRCHHGPQEPAPYVAGDCTLPGLAGLLQPDEYLVLDIKTDFQKTGAAILEQIGDRPVIRQIIFQLYKPENVASFNQWRMRYDGLIGPIVSVYNSERSLNHVYKFVRKIGIRAYAFPFPRMPALTLRDENILLLTYPVKTCEEKKKAFTNKIYGVYIRNDLECEGEKQP